MRDSLVYELLEEAGLPSLRTAPYAVVLDYGEGPVRLGLYTMVEVVSCAFVDLRPAVLSSWRQQGTPGRSVHPMAKPTKKQQRHALKKQKVRAEKRRALRISSAQQADSSPYDTAPLLPATPLNDEAALRASIQEFAFRRANAPDMERALALYFGNDFVHTRTLTADEPEIAAFQEWYFFDFVPERRTRLIEQFAEEVGPTLPPAQQAMLHSWIETNRLRLFEVQEVTPGVGEVVKDLLSGEVIHGSDISMSRNARRWQIVLARILRTGERWSFTGAGWMFTPEDKHRLVRFITDRWRHYQAGHPEATFDDFYRDHSLDLLKLGQQVQADALHPLYRSAEGHELVRAGATYRVLDYRQVIERLDQAEEFVFAGPSETLRDADHYNWLLRGRSQAPEIFEEKTERQKLLMRTEWSAGPGSPSFLNLGDLSVGRQTLRLDCSSRERLALGRQLLEALLNGLIVHKQDTFALFDFEASAPASAPPPRARPLTDPGAKQVERELLEREAQKWLNNPVPALDNQTPLQAVQHPDGRAKVEEMLKTVEYYQEGGSTLKDSPLDVRNLRRALGLTA
jgi:hypothetical protein